MMYFQVGWLQLYDVTFWPKVGEMRVGQTVEVNRYQPVEGVVLQEKIKIASHNVSAESRFIYIPTVYRKLFVWFKNVVFSKFVP